MLTSVLALLLLAFHLCPQSSTAQEVCFSKDVAGQMLVTLEKAQVCEEQITAYGNSNAELQTQINLLKENVKLLQDQAAIYKSMVDMKDRFADTQAKICEQQIKAATPSFWDNMQKYFVGVGIGAVLAGIGILIL